MTLREVSVSLERIGVRTHNTFAKEASLHGIEITPILITAPEKTEKLSPEAQKKVDASMKRMIEEKSRSVRG